MHQHHTTHFQTRKLNCLSKRDKSSAGRIDPRAVDICAEINRRNEYYTTSSCAGRCFLYRGDGIKSWHNNSSSGGSHSQDGVSASCASSADGDDSHETMNGNAISKLGFFQRYRVNHDLVREPQRYFNLTTLLNNEDSTGGGDPIPEIGQFESGNNAGFKSKLDEIAACDGDGGDPIWLRFEPFILHVMCRSLKAASVLMALARPSFKNVGLTSWNTGSGGGAFGDEAAREEMVEDGNTKKNQQCKGGGPRYLVAIWGDEGLDMPLSLPTSPGTGLYYNPDDEDGTAKNANWLAQLVNERHARNWKKIDRFVKAVRGLEEDDVDCAVGHNAADIDGAIHGIDRVDLTTGDEESTGYQESVNGSQSKRGPMGLPIPRSYDGKRRTWHENLNASYLTQFQLSYLFYWYTFQRTNSGW